MQSANGVYWIVLEVGVAVIAVNLPVLNNLARREGLQTMVHQLRSIISLRSRHSDVERASSHSDILISDKVIAAGKSGGGSI